MISKTGFTGWLLLLLGMFGSISGFAQTPVREDVSVLSVTEEVEAIDYETREVVLRDASGQLKQVTVDDRVKRLDEIKVGDRVTVDIFVSNLYEVRAPTEAELKEPFVELDHRVQANTEQLPGQAMLKQFRSVCSIVALNSVNMTGTLQCPENKFLAVAIKDPKNLEKLRIGHTVVLTHTEAMAIALEKDADGEPLLKPADYE